MTRRTFYIMKQEAPATDKPWWVSQCVIDEERETVTHRIAYGPFEHEAEAKEVLRAAGGEA